MDVTLEPEREKASEESEVVTKEASPSPPSSSAKAAVDFSEYMWMEDEEEFDRQVLKELEEEELMEQCIQAMLHDEYENEKINGANKKDSEFTQDFDKLCLEENTEIAKTSTLNPNAEEFVPGGKKPSS